MADEAAAAEVVEDQKPKALKDINVYSRKFLLVIGIIAVCIYGIKAGELKWEFGVNTMAWVVMFYCIAEGHADNGGQLGRVLKMALAASGALAGLKLPGGANLVIDTLEGKPPKKPKNPTG